MECGGKSRRDGDTAFAGTVARCCAQARSKAASAPRRAGTLPPHSKGQADADTYWQEQQRAENAQPMECGGKSRRDDDTALDQTQWSRERFGNLNRGRNLNRHYPALPPESKAVPARRDAAALHMIPPPVIRPPGQEDRWEFQPTVKP
jgi:hypothetical protein